MRFSYKSKITIKRVLCRDNKLGESVLIKFRSVQLFLESGRPQHKYNARLDFVSEGLSLILLMVEKIRV